MFALNIDSATGRILSATYPEFASEDAVIVDVLPEGDISDYLYLDGEYVYDPLPKPEEPEDPVSDAERIAELEAALELLLSGATE